MLFDVISKTRWEHAAHEEYLKIYHDVVEYLYSTGWIDRKIRTEIEEACFRDPFQMCINHGTYIISPHINISVQSWRLGVDYVGEYDCRKFSMDIKNNLDERGFEILASEANEFFKDYFDDC
jgi:hypothetical protein